MHRIIALRVKHTYKFYESMLVGWLLVLSLVQVSINVTVTVFVSLSPISSTPLPLLPHSQFYPSSISPLLPLLPLLFPGGDSRLTGGRGTTVSAGRQGDQTYISQEVCTGIIHEAKCSIKRARVVSHCCYVTTVPLLVSGCGMESGIVWGTTVLCCLVTVTIP